MIWAVCFGFVTVFVVKCNMNCLEKVGRNTGPRARLDTTNTRTDEWLCFRNTQRDQFDFVCVHSNKLCFRFSRNCMACGLLWHESSTDWIDKVSTSQGGTVRWFRQLLFFSPRRLRLVPDSNASCDCHSGIWGDAPLKYHTECCQHGPTIPATKSDILYTSIPIYRSRIRVRTKVWNGNRLTWLWRHSMQSDGHVVVIESVIMRWISSSAVRNRIDGYQDHTGRLFTS